MVSSSDVWRALRIWWAGFVSLIICLGAGSGGLRAQERLAANLTISHETGGSPARIQIFEGSKHAQDLTGACDTVYAKLRYAMEELIIQRFESARLSIELAEAKAEGAEIQKVSRQQERLLTALMAALATRDRQDAAVHSETADLRRRLEAAQNEVQRKSAENDRLAAELAAIYKAAATATVMAQDNLAVINAQIEALHAAAGNAASARAEQPAELLSALWIDVAPSMLRQKPYLEATR